MMEGPQATTSFVYVILLLVGCYTSGTYAMCYKVETSEGVVDLDNGQYACAPPNVMGRTAPLGQYFFHCSSAGAFLKTCGSVLRFDVKNKVCNWPALMDCSVPTAAQTTTPETTPNQETAESLSQQTTESLGQQTTKSFGQQTTDTRPSGQTTETPAQQTTETPGVCSRDNCRLPDCFCFGDTPANISTKDLPMFILLTFDDAVTTTVFSKVYRDPLIRNSWRVFNPNGCPIRAAFFVSDQYTDYKLVQYLHDGGHEIASHTMNHTSHENTYSEVADEIVGLRDTVVARTNISKESVVGFRAPYLKIYDDLQYDVLSDYNFKYDSSLINLELQFWGKPLWPFTLDFPIASERCPNKPCPIRRHPGLWEVPMNGWLGGNGRSCGMIDGCSIKGNAYTGSPQDFLDFFRYNFQAFYRHKVPMHMFTHASMFLKGENAIIGLRLFVQELLLTHDDVWFVTPSQLVDWMKNPVTNEEVKTHSRFSCSV